MPCLISIFGTFRGTGDRPNENPGALFSSVVDIFSNITNREIQWPPMLIMRKIGQVSLVGCTNDWHNCRSSRKLILRLTQPIARVHLAVYSVIFRICQAHRFKIEVRLKWDMCEKELNTFENIPVV